MKATDLRIAAAEGLSVGGAAGEFSASKIHFEWKNTCVLLFWHSH